jgi:hypothetical protein
MLVSLGAIWTRLAVIETQMRQQTRLLQSVLAVVQSTGADGSFELPDGVVLPAKTLQELLDIEKVVENDDDFRKMVCTCT